MTCTSPTPPARRRAPRRALGLLALALAACSDANDPAPVAGSEPSPEPVGVLLVSFDTTRADRMGHMGHPGAHTPVLDELAARGVVFERAWAPAPITLPSHATMLTGSYPVAHGVRHNAVHRLGEQALLLPEVLQRQGFRTAACVGSFVLEGRFGLAQGFEHYGSPRSSSMALQGTARLERPADEVVDEALAWLDGVDPDEAWFLFFHVNDPHGPFTPPAAWAQRVADPYDAEIAFADDELGRLLRGIEARGLDRRLLVLATSDHGESLGEHGEDSHGIFIYDATLRVPLVAWASDGSLPRGARVDAPVSLADLAPTVLDWLGLPAELLPDARTPSLLRTLDADAAGADRALYVESELPWHQHRWHPLRGLVWRDHKLVDAPRRELYALDDDPRELRDLTRDDPARAEVFADRLAALLGEHPSLAWSEGADAVDEDERAALAALGYLGVSTAVPTGDPSLPLPADRIGDFARIREALAILRAAPADLDAQQARVQLEPARALLRDVLASNPDDPLACLELGRLELRCGRPAEAEVWLRRHARLEPSAAGTRHDLGLALQALGRADEAALAMRRAVALDPRGEAAVRWLVRHHEGRAEYGLAAGWLAGWVEHALVDDATRERLRGELARKVRTAERYGQEVGTPAPPPAEDG